MKIFFHTLRPLFACVALPVAAISETQVSPDTLTKGLDPVLPSKISVPSLPSDTTGIQLTERPSDLNAGSAGLSGTDCNASSSRVTSDAFRTMSDTKDSSSLTTPITNSLQTLGASRSNLGDITNSGGAFASKSPVAEDSDDTMTYIYILLGIGVLVATWVGRNKDKAVDPAAGPPDGPMM